MIEILARRFSFIPIKKKRHIWRINIHLAVLHSIFWVTQATYKLVTAGFYQFYRRWLAL
jgi:hypothetical protein